MRFMAWIAGKREATFTRNTVTFATSAMVFNCEKAKAILGYKPEVTVQEGIQLTMEVGPSQVLLFLYAQLTLSLVVEVRS